MTEQEGKDFKKNLERFARTIEYPNDIRLCWLWKGDHNGRGYGRFFYKGVRYPAHRVMMCLVRGQAHPNGYVVDHMCSVPACVNPYHLRYLTPLENMRASRVVGAVFNRGVNNGQCKLSEVQVSEIRARYKIGEKQYRLAKAFGISQSTVSLIVTGKNWRHGG